MEKYIEAWKDEELGIKRDCTSNLRFADAVLMMASFLKQLEMVEDFKTARMHTVLKTD